MIRYVVLLAALALTACEGSNNGVPSTGGTSGGLLNSMASGAAAGVGAGIGHAAVNHAINKWQDRRASRQSSGFNRMSRGINHR